MKKIATLLILTISLSACTGQEQSKLETLDKKSAREVTLSTEIKGDTVLHLVKQRIWAHGELVLAKVDTLKTLQSIPDTKSNQPNENMSKVPIYVTIE